MNIYTRKLSLFFILLSAILFSCVTINIQATPISLRTTSTVFGTPNLTSISSNTATYEPLWLTHVSTPTVPQPPIGLPLTFTPLPTYSHENAQQIVMELYENALCDLPCWWGIIPGQTDWREAWQFLERFATNQWPWDNLLLESQKLPGYMYFQVFLNVPKTDDEFNYFSLNHLIFVISIDTFNVDYIDVNTGNIDDYTIPALLRKYGEPENIYVYLSDHPLPQYTGVTLILYYPQHGFISSHFTTVTAEEIRKPEFTACFQKVTNLYLWSKEQNMDFEERLKISGTDAIGLKLIDTVSEFNTEDFHQTYLNSQGENLCVDFNFTK